MAGDGNKQGRAIFISYRRDDSEGEAGRLFDDLVRAYGDSSVFMDVAGIQPGIDFRKAIDDNVASCGVLLAIVGPTWATITGSDGIRRLDNPNDFVRLEIASALKRSIPVIPVLVHDARMPALDQLPDDLKDLRYRNSVELTHARWNSDVALLIDALKSYVSVDTHHQTETVHATVPVQLPAPQAPASAPNNTPPKSKTPLILGIGAAGVLVLAVAIYALSRPRPIPQPQPQPSPQPLVVTPGGESALLGNWKITQEPAGGDDLAQIAVTDSAGQLKVQAFGKCPGQPCDWGARKATLNGAQAVTDSWDLRNTPKETKLQRNATISISPAAGGLAVSVKNVYQMPNGQTREVSNQLQFVKIP